MPVQTKNNYSAWVEVDLGAIRHNFRAIRKLTDQRKVGSRISVKKACKDCCPQILSVVKADSYGHGMLPAARELVKSGTDFLGVSEVSEGVVLRQNGVKKSVLVLETPLPSALKQIVDYDLIATVCAYGTASALNAYARSLNKKAAVHVKVDTGMGRLGVRYQDACDFIKKISSLSHLDVQGIYTHFPVADTDQEFTVKQIDIMSDIVHQLDREGLIIPYIHGANSIGMTRYDTRIFNVVRPGLMLYGLYPAKGYERVIALKPAMSVKARVIFVKMVEKDRGISYGHTFVSKKNMKVATLSIGYNDGFMRAFSNKADVLIGGKRCKVLGRVTMDQIVVDVTGVENARIGSEAVIIGKQKKEIVSADELAGYANTINYEIVCSLGNRLPRVYKNGQ
ncbi:MAG: alanine racemase [Candidatus Omnitrophota bacterium]